MKFIPSFTFLHFLVLGLFLFNGKCLAQGKLSSQDTLVANSLFIKGDSVLLSGDYKRSNELFIQAADGYGKSNQWKRVAICYNNIADSFCKLRQLDQSKIFSNRVVNEVTQKYGQHHLEKAKAYANLGFIYALKGDAGLALQYYENSEDIIQNSPTNNHPFLVKIYSGYAHVYYIKGNLDKSLEMLLLALETGNQVLEKNSSKLAFLYNNIGGLYGVRGDQKKSLEFLQMGLDINIKRYGSNHPKLMNTYDNLSQSYRKMGQFKRSLEYSNKACNIAEEYLPENHEKIADLYLFIGSQLIEVGLVDSAKTLTFKGIKILESKEQMSVSLMRAYAYAALLYDETEEFDKSYEYGAKALKIHNELNLENTNNGDIYNLMSRVYLELEDFEKSIVYSKKAIKSLRNSYGSRSKVLTHAYINLADAYAYLQTFDSAKVAIDSAKVSNSLLYNDAGYSNYQFNDIGNEISIYLLKSIIEVKGYLVDFNLEHLEIAEAINTKGDSIISHFIKNSTRHLDDKLTVSRKIKPFYTTAITTCFKKYKETGKVENLARAFYYSEKAKNNLLRGSVQLGQIEKFFNIPDSILEKEEGLRVDMAYFESELNKDSNNKTGIDSVHSELEKKMFQSTNAFYDLQEHIKSNYKDYFNFSRNAELKGLSDIKNALGDDRSLVEYFVGDSTIYIFSLDKYNLSIKAQPKPDSLSFLVKGFRDAIVSSDFNIYRDNGCKLYDLLIAPVSDKMTGDRLVVVPDGPLWDVNFDLLLSQDSGIKDYRYLDYLMKDFAISYSYSADLLIEEKNSQRSKGGEVLAFSFGKEKEPGNVMNFQKYRNNLEPLPGSVNEIFQVSKLTDGRYYYGDYASEEAFKKNAQKYSVIHLAVHGLVDEKFPMNSGLQFMPDSDSIEDGFLHAYELYNLSIDADMAVLSACNTAAGKLMEGEGLMSLGRAFSYAGCKSLVITQWQLADESSSLLMDNFYKELTKGITKDKALQRAKLQYLEQADVSMTNPMYWGAFIVVGDVSSIKLAKLNDQNYLLLICAVSVILLILVAKRKYLFT
ncbi:MAG: CHAT domain-containing tetratricopeptide repeat protein [Reichenbachiella sp.]|uniref:CHAT domain-containing protein n=1 Tax=Reichenbachiella sp. TaxID=2184521 RepID=UPI0029675F93|nr:CHAT domain-containing tetratricopeptide repeat protein [Reichenbachiella sp.]MDW3210929.1 CHAT domain-containing tetratricopeptide repeat protein [Reichenbachiella sp.]